MRNLRAGNARVTLAPPWYRRKIAGVLPRAPRPTPSSFSGGVNRFFALRRQLEATPPAGRSGASEGLTVERAGHGRVGGPGDATRTGAADRDRRVSGAALGPLDLCLWLADVGSGLRLCRGAAGAAQGLSPQLLRLFAPPRGTPERPGVVLGLDRGGACKGIAYRVPAADVAAALHYLWDREMSR